MWLTSLQTPSASSPPSSWISRSRSLTWRSRRGGRPSPRRAPPPWPWCGDSRTRSSPRSPGPRAHRRPGPSAPPPSAWSAGAPSLSTWSHDLANTLCLTVWELRQSDPAIPRHVRRSVTQGLCHHVDTQTLQRIVLSAISSFLIWPALSSAVFISVNVSRHWKGSNKQLTPMILAPALAIRTAHSPGLLFFLNKENQMFSPSWVTSDQTTHHHSCFSPHLSISTGPHAHCGGHRLVIAQSQLYGPLHLLDVVEVLHDDQVNVVVDEDLQPLPQLPVDLLLAEPVPVWACLHDAPGHDGPPLVRALRGDVTAGLVDLSTLTTWAHSQHNIITISPSACTPRACRRPCCSRWRSGWCPPRPRRTPRPGPPPPPGAPPSSPACSSLPAGAVGEEQ